MEKDKYPNYVPIPGPKPKPPKPGYLTTEFWITVFVQFVGLLAVAGVFTGDDAAKYTKVAEIAGGLIGMVVAQFSYAKSRSITKAAEAKASECLPENAESLSEREPPECVGQQGSVQMRAMVAMLAGVLVAFIACGGANLKSISDMSPKEKAVFFMSVYSEQAENYKTLAAMPDLTEAQKEVMREKKKIMVEVYPLISLYTEYVEAGAIPNKETEDQIISYLDRLAMATVL